MPKAEFAYKNKAYFTIIRGNDMYTYQTGRYYTSMISNGTAYVRASQDTAFFVVTVSSGADISDDLTCSLEFT